ncbi:copper homeostasis protein CutC [Allomuricauda sp. NBRC 101325]|uniref:copper homeostasis protein CutC n=1 Tax=Allomuricauda sp. NBRC 101325 TaxID=1113758 RepID=UPI0024A5C7A6|nr:copper homeostasis protein CutC [Muricauda sp. NBRC 101325]GLU42750.1 copper homeostasis protein CutC [Muricauda sp. NBRC 101325]
MLVEICANSLESAMHAVKAGADRIELCSELGVGGITPSAGLIRLVKKQLNIPVHVLLRPRGGHFTYSDYEFEVMKADILACKEMGVDGIVSGILHPDFTVDVERTKTLVDLTGDLHFVFHRAFDWVSNPSDALKELESIGVQTVLTSGGETSAAIGLPKLVTWQQHTTMTLMAGGGVSPDNAMKFKNAGLNAIHCSGSTFSNTLNIGNKISMNSSKHLVEDQVAVSNPELLKAIIAAVK